METDDVDASGLTSQKRFWPAPGRGGRGTAWQIAHSSYGTLERPVWELTMIDKRNKGRTVPVSIATLEALKAHRSDRGRDLMAPTVFLSPSAPLL
jgi:integrase